VCFETFVQSIFLLTINGPFETFCGVNADNLPATPRALNLFMGNEVVSRHLSAYITQLKSRRIMDTRCLASMVTMALRSDTG